jgi:uncharacterized protein YecE (DUF72 family)
MIRVGPAGWSYADWAGVVYPRPKPKGFDPLEYLSGFFDTIEVNSTFYRPATPETAARWVDRVAANPDFRFTAKLWRRFTHERGTGWTTGEIADARAAFDALRDGGRLGAVLLQFPWSFRESEANREWLGDLLRDLADLPLVVEVRHASWATGDFLAELSERGVGFVNIDQPLFRDSIGPSAHVTGGLGYIRVHGRNYREWWRKSAGVEARYDYLYSREELEPWVERAKEIEETGGTVDTYVVTNNHYRGKAVANALMIRAALTGRKVAAPGSLLDEYAAALQEHAFPATAEAPTDPVRHRSPSPGRSEDRRA